MTNAERQFLWEQYPEVQEMYEEYNGILLEDDPGWERLVARSHEIHALYAGNKAVEAVLLDTVAQLEKLAKKRRYG